MARVRGCSTGAARAALETVEKVESCSATRDALVAGDVSLAQAAARVARTALELGTLPGFDGVTCSREGCDRKHALQWDHLHPKANGGPVSFENMRPLCGPAHWEKTEQDRNAGKLRKRKDRAP